MWHHERLKAVDWKGEPFRWLHHKMDGFRCTFFKENGKLTAHLRTTEVTSKLERYDWFKTMARNMANFSSVECELIVPNEPAIAVSQSLARTIDKHIVPYAFAIPQWNGCSLAKHDIRDAQHIAEQLGLRFCTYLVKPEGETASAELFKLTLKGLNEIQKQRGVHPVEGFVLKQHQYEGWYKWKPQLTVDCVVTGTIAGAGKYRNQIGSLVVSVLRDNRWVEIASVSGMDDATRLMFSSDPPLGKIVEVEYMQIASQGRLRHPRFLRLREDKRPDECVYSQLST